MSAVVDPVSSTITFEVTVGIATDWSVDGCRMATVGGALTRALAARFAGDETVASIAVHSHDPFWGRDFDHEEYLR